ncbi:MAG: GAF domain-containing protein [Chloroflexota bacterium]
MSFRSLVPSGLRSRLLLLILVGIVPFYALVVYRFLDRRSDEVANAEINALRWARLAAEAHDRTIQAAQDLLVGLSGRIPVRYGDEGTCRSELDTLQRNLSGYESLAVVEVTGEVRCRSLNGTSVNMAQRQDFIRSRSTPRFVIGDFGFDRSTGRPSLFVGQPIVDSAGDVTAWLIAGLRVDTLAGISDAAMFPPGTTVAVLHPSGVIAMRHPDPGLWVGRDVSALDLYQTILTGGEQGTARGQTADGVDRLIGFSKTSATASQGALIVTVGVPYEVAVGDLDRELWRDLAVLSVFALLAVGLAWYAGDVMVARPVQLLLAATRRIARGDFGLRTGVDRRAGDLAALGRSFDRMADALQERIRRQESAERQAAEARVAAERQSARLLALHRAASRVAMSSLSLDDIVERMLDSVTELMGGNGAGLYRWDVYERTIRLVRQRSVSGIGMPDTVVPGSGLTGRAFSERAPVIVDDYAAWSGATPSGIESRLNSGVAVPLTVDGSVQGVLVVKKYGADAAHWTEEDAQLLTLFGDQVMAAIERARLLGESVARSELLSSLLYASEILAEGTTLEETLRAVHDEALRLANHASVRIMLTSDAEADLWCAYSNDEFQPSVGVGPVEHELALRVARDRDALLVPDITREFENVSSEESSAVRSFLGLAVKIRNELIGVISMTSPVVRDFGEDEIACLVSFADLASVSIERARLFEASRKEIEARQRAEENVQALNRELEQRVAQRTSELENAIADLNDQILERKRAEAAQMRLSAQVERERATLEAVMSGMTDGLIVMDAYGSIRYVNERTCQFFGVDSDEMLKRGFEELLPLVANHLADPEGTFATYRAAAARAEMHPSFEIALAGGTVRDLRAQLFPVVDGSGESRGTGMLLRDVTTETDLARTKDELVSVVSHELRTPLASIVGFSGLLLEREFPEKKRRQFLSAILEDGKHLTQLIDNFLDLQRMASGRNKIEPAACALSEMVAQSVRIVGEDPERPIAVDLPRDLPDLFADRERVVQVLINLLSNARKYSPEGGPVHVSARADGLVVEVTVADSGLGLPPEALESLFERFYRVDNSDRRQIEGTGLGLAICRQLVEAHGGRIWAESDGLGSGSRFRFTLPVVGADSATCVPFGPRVDALLVSDDEASTTALLAELRTAGLSCSQVKTADAALAAASETPPRAVVLDLGFTDASPLTLLRCLREINGFEGPVAALARAGAEEEPRDVLTRLGVVAVVDRDEDAPRCVRDAVCEALEIVLTEAEPSMIRKTA